MSTVAEALREAAARLSRLGDTGRLDAELLMAHALGTDRSAMLLRSMADAVPPAFAALLERRLAHEPIAYILGNQPFYGREFHVSPAVLIPRDDSESVVEAALAATGGEGRVLDCGVGSGALLLTFLAERAGWSGVGIDRSGDALAMAKRNADALGLAERAEILLCDWHEDEWSAGLGRFDCIIANPPYVEEGAQLDSEVRGWEPEGALFAGREGLDDYRALVPQLPGLLAAHGFAVLEIGASQAGPVREIARAAGFAAQMRRDLAGRPRALLLSLS